MNKTARKYLEAEGWLTDSEAGFLHAAAGEARPGEWLVNIGVEYGKSVIALASGMRVRSFLYGIDIDLSKFDPRVLYKYGKNSLYAMCETDSSLAPMPDGQVGVLFVDGDHTYEGVKADCSWSLYVRQGGLVIFHDCWQYGGPPGVVHPVCPGVNKAVEEWVNYYPDDWNELESIDSMRIFRRV